jgi:hypothetical protein
MNEQERQTHFQGFAKLLWEDIRNKLDFWIDTAEPHFDANIKEILAQRAYDLMFHAVKHSLPYQQSDRVD